MGPDHAAIAQLLVKAKKLKTLHVVSQPSAIQTDRPNLFDWSSNSLRSLTFNIDQVHVFIQDVLSILSGCRLLSNLCILTNSEAEDYKRHVLMCNTQEQRALVAQMDEREKTGVSCALRIVRDPGAAEDLTIEAFFRMHRAHARFDSSRGFEPWARRIATRAALDWLRARKPEQPAAPEFFSTVAAQADSDPVISAEIRRKVALAFDRLPAKLRAAATLAVIEERPHKEIADALGISAAAVKLRVFRAMRKLRIDLEQMGMRP